MRLTLQDQLDAIEKHLDKNFIEMTGETMDDRLTEEEIEAVIQTVFEYASQFREPSTQGGEEKITGEWLETHGFEPSGSAAVMCWIKQVNGGAIQWFDDSSFSLSPIGSRNAFCPNGAIETITQMKSLYLLLTGENLNPKE